MRGHYVLFYRYVCLRCELGIITSYLYQFITNILISLGKAEWGKAMVGLKSYKKGLKLTDSDQPLSCWSRLLSFVLLVDQITDIGDETCV